VGRPRRNANQVAPGAQDLVDPPADMQAEQPLPGDEEAHLVFAMGVLGEELLA
jgi:hypothetical protein